MPAGLLKRFRRHFFSSSAKLIPMPLKFSPRILLADRDRERRVLVRRMLREFDVQDIVSSAGILGALEKIKVRRVDVVLASDDMDVWGGLEFARMVQASRPRLGGMLPVILMLRTRDGEAARPLYEETGIAANLVRPFTARDLSLAINRAVA